MRLSYNPILEDLLEAQEREEENLVKVRRYRQDITDTLQTMQDEISQRSRRYGIHLGSGSPADRKKVSIMQSSLSREQVESFENKLRADLKGPNYYYPRHYFGKRQG